MGRKSASSQSKQDPCAPIHPQYFVFCEKTSGLPRFRLDASADGKIAVERAASMLAMHCLVRGQSPEDYTVMVQFREDLFGQVRKQAASLLEVGRAITSGVRLSRREQEVLQGVLQNLANKEIAGRLNLSHRTVKFHVSSLLAKFGVADRVQLMREAAVKLFSAGPSSAAFLAFPAPLSEKSSEAAKPPVAAPAQPRGGRVLRMLRRQVHG